MESYLLWVLLSPVCQKTYGQEKVGEYPSWDRLVSGNYNVLSHLQCHTNPGRAIIISPHKSCVR